MGRRRFLLYMLFLLGGIFRKHARPIAYRAGVALWDTLTIPWVEDMERIELIAPSVYTLPTEASDLHIFSQNIDRQTTEPGSSPTMPLSQVEIGRGGRHIRIDNVSNVSWYAQHDSAEVSLLYDFVITNIGWQSTADRLTEEGGHGWYIYQQNEIENSPKVADTGVLVAGFAAGKAYLTANIQKLHHLYYGRTIFVGKEFLVGGVNLGADDIEFDDCVFLDAHLAAGYLAPNGSIRITNSLFGCAGTFADRFPAGCASIGNGRQQASESSWQHVVFTGNTLIADRDFRGTGFNRALVVSKATPAAMATWEVDNNIYYSRHSSPFALNGQSLTFEQWQDATGFDQHSTFIAAEPDEPIVRVFPVPERSAAFVAVINPTGQESIPLPSSLAGDTTIRDVRNYDIAYNSRKFRMWGEVTPPSGWSGSPTDSPLWRNTFPRYGAFRVALNERGND